MLPAWKLPPTWIRALCASALWLLLGGCGRKPSPDLAAGSSTSSPATAIASPASGRNMRQPTAQDLAAHFRHLVPAKILDVTVTADPPVPDPDTAGGWLMQAKVVFTPLVDLCSLPQPKDVQEAEGITRQFNELVEWRNQFVQSAFAHRHYPDLPIGTLEDHQFLIVTSRKGVALPPVYGQTAARWQVDHWSFANVDMPGLPTTGKPRSEFDAGALVLGSPEATVYLQTGRDLVAKVRAKKLAIEQDYTARLSAATAPGQRYIGKITHPLGTVAAEVRFGERPSGDQGSVSFELSLPATPSYHLSFTGHLNRQLPLAANVADLSAVCVHATGQPGMGTVPSTLIRGLGYSGRDKLFVFSDGGMEGDVSGFNGTHHLVAAPVR